MSQFPVEIFDKIISEVWSSPLSIAERIILMTSSNLVNSSWMTIFTRISLRDVYIPCLSYADHYSRILRNDHPIYAQGLAERLGLVDEVADRLCRSVTFRVEGSRRSGIHGADQMMERVIRKSLAFMAKIENLRVCIHYHNCGFDGMQCLGRFPDNVTQLGLQYTFSDSYTAYRYRLEFQSLYDIMPWSIPFARNLSILGAPEEFVMDVISSCERLETLVTDSHMHPKTISFLSSGKRAPGEPLLRDYAGERKTSYLMPISGSPQHKHPKGMLLSTPRTITIHPKTVRQLPFGIMMVEDYSLWTGVKEEKATYTKEGVLVITLA